MAAADLREELNCSICWDIYTDPVTLPCGHSFCQGCIGRTWDGQKEIGETPSCPECRQRYRRQPELKRNLRLRNIAERLLSALPKSNGTGVLCTYCVHAPVPAAKSCLLCETSLCGAHITAHIKSLEHVLIKPTTSFSNRKCSRHKKLLEYYCCYDGACICASCCLAGGHWGHCLRALKEASEKKKKKLRKVLEKLSPKIKETEREVQRLQERSRDMEERAAGETERVTDLFKNIRYRLEALEKRVLSEVSRQKEELSLTFTSLIRELEIKKDEMSRMIRHIEELCNMADPLAVLQEHRESHGAAFCGLLEEKVAQEYNNEKKWENTKYLYENVKENKPHSPPFPALDMHLVDLDISETLVTGLAGIVTRIKGRIWGQKTMDLVLDTNSAANNVSVSGDRKCASFSRTDQRHPLTPDRFESSQVLSTKSFPSGRCYWEMEVSESMGWGVGVAYPSIERHVVQSLIGNNNKSWRLYKTLNKYAVKHDNIVTQLPHVPSCWRIRISLDYEAGRLSFYELSEPIRHLHTFTAKFTEPLHAAFSVWRKNAWVRIIS
uniref:Uncharacterized protein n=1 Tax=Xenopus tropicalis TaxID=8364 RepID=A0A1B8Y158_XENTR